MSFSAPLEALVSVASESAWLVGGAVRDRVLGRPTDDFDIAVAGDAREVARSLARAVDAHVFGLSESFGVWRVVARDHWQVDVLPVAGRSIEADLAQRDFTINAIAEPVGGGEYVDPFRGLVDVRARILRMVSPRAFADDPLRTMRLARLACELGFEVEEETAAAAAASVSGLARVAPERVFAELKRIVIADRALEGLALMDSLGATDVVLPELSRMRGVEQSQYHHLDVYEHTRLVLASTIELARRPEQWFGEHADPVALFLAEPLANELTRGQALRFGALLHDVAKPQTRQVTTDGRITFVGHDIAGADVAAGVLARLKASERLREYVAALTRNHLRLGFLVHEAPVSRRAIYRYLRACEPVQVDVTLLSVADRLATRGRGADEAITRHLELARELLGEALAWQDGRPRPPLRGDELARAVGLRPGPELGRLLEELEEASFAGEISSREQAIDRARAMVAGAGGAGGPRSGGPLRGGGAGGGCVGSAAVRDPDCIFCKIVAGEIPAQIVEENERTIAFMDINPATRGHVLVIPREHSTDLLEIDADDLAAVVLMAQTLAGRIMDRLDADGVNLLNSCRAAAWQTVFHFHVHVIPRYEDDPMQLPWIPAPGDSAEIEAAAEALR